MFNSTRSQLEDVVSSIKPLEVLGLFPQKQGGGRVWGLGSIDSFLTTRVFPGFSMFCFPRSMVFVCLEKGVFKPPRLVCHLAQSGNSGHYLSGDKLEKPFWHLWVEVEPFTFVSCGFVFFALFSFSKLLFFHFYLFALVLLVEEREVKN